MSKHNHAKVFMLASGYQLLAYLDHDEDADNLLVMRFRLWCDGVEGPVSFTPTIDSEEALSDETVKLWEDNIRRGFEELTLEKAEGVVKAADILNLIAKLDAEKAESIEA